MMMVIIIIIIIIIMFFYLCFATFYFSSLSFGSVFVLIRKNSENVSINLQFQVQM